MTTAEAVRHSTHVDRSALALNVDVLGPLVLRVDGREVEVPGPRRRALLAVLALADGRPVSSRRLAEALWPDDPPENATASLQNHVSRLRTHLAPYGGRLTLEPAGYVLRLEDFELDADAVRRTAAQDPGSALALFRGPALTGLEDFPELEAHRVRLGESRLALVDDDLEHRLEHGAPDVVADAAAASAVSPYRERTTLLLVRALAAAGRVVEAMETAASFRARLAEETGLDPTPALADLEQLVASGAVGPAAERRRVARPDGPMVGRQQERDEVHRLLDGHQLVTLTGPGGVGKTRLALDVAAELSAGHTVVVVGLTAVEQPGRVPEAVATALGLRLSAAGAEEIALALADRALLLLLDNCEHVIDACRSLVSALRRHAPRVRVLATSRITLDLPDEYVVRLQPLPVPHADAAPGAARRQSSVRAFVEHVRRRDPEYALDDTELDDLLEILRALDGLPLGIELAARQRAVMPLAAVRERLDRALDLGTGRHGPDDRRRHTLRATIDSSYALLDPSEQDLLRAIAIFPGGVDLSTVEDLAPASDHDPVELLHRLVDSSLLVADPASGRYRLLFTVRSYLLDLLRESGEHAGATRRFVERCVDVAEQILVEGRTRDEARADRRLRAEMANFRAARDLANTDLRVRISVAVGDATTWRDLREAWTWALELVDEPALQDHPGRAEVLAAAGEAARLLGDLDAAVRHASRARDLTEAGTPTWARALSVIAVVAHYRGDFDLARITWAQAGEVELDDRCSFIGSAALAAAYGGETETAHSLLDRAAALALCPSHDAFLAYVRGELALADRPELAVTHYRSAIATAGAVGCSFVEGVSRVSLAAALVRVGDLIGAATQFGVLIDHWRGTGQQTQLWTTARNAAGLFAATGRPRTAALLLICADAAPGAAAVDERIAGRSGRMYTPVQELVDAEELDALRAEAGRIGPAAVLDTARRELAELEGTRRVGRET